MKRDLRIDFMRFLGLSLIILAHVQAPFTLTQIRCFDVPLMVFVSGMTVSGKSIPNFWKYLWKRTKRLVVPVWLFLTVYLSVFYLVQDLVLPEPYLTGRMICRSFLLLDESIGYVWIIRVFLLVMLLTPFIISVSKKIESDYVFSVIIFAILLLNQIVYQVLVIMDAGIGKELFEDFVVYGIAYMVPFAMGVRVKDSSTKKLLLYCVLLGLLFLLFCLNNFEVGNNPIGVSTNYKFPPRPYFIVYGSFISIILWLTKRWWEWIAGNELIVFVGQNTIWIYLWHMPFALFATVYMYNWVFKYVFVYSLALLLFWIQYKIVRNINNTLINKYLLG